MAQTSMLALEELYNHVRSTLPVSRLNTQPKAPAMPIPINPGRYRNNGQCHIAQNAVRIMLAVSALNLLCNLGSANPRQPASSPKPKKSRLYNKKPAKLNSGNSLATNKPDKSRGALSTHKPIIAAITASRNGLA